MSLIFNKFPLGDLGVALEKEPFETATKHYPAYLYYPQNMKPAETPKPKFFFEVWSLGKP